MTKIGWRYVFWSLAGLLILAPFTNMAHHLQDLQTTVDDELLDGLMTAWQALQAGLI